MGTVSPCILNIPSSSLTSTGYLSVSCELPGECFIRIPFMALSITWDIHPPYLPPWTILLCNPIRPLSRWSTPWWQAPGAIPIPSAKRGFPETGVGWGGVGLVKQCVCFTLNKVITDSEFSTLGLASLPPTRLQTRSSWICPIGDIKMHLNDFRITCPSPPKLPVPLKQVTLRSTCFSSTRQVHVIK